MCMGRNSTCLFGPVADGVVIPENWDEILFSGHGWKGRLLIGSNRREMMEDGNPDPASMAVSYTHLDVYKRQGINRGAAKSNEQQSRQGDGIAQRQKQQKHADEADNLPQADHLPVI